jgi:16S rRNA (cytosine1402-N4)-methyltransferase
LSFKHKPVLLNEVLRFLMPSSGEIHVDGTVGGGGHAVNISKYLGPKGLLIGIDRDQEALEAAGQRLAKADYCPVQLVKGNFRDIKEIVSNLGIKTVQGVFFDLGFSSYQVDSPARGFSYQQDVYLDMRMDSSQKKTAAELVNTLTQEELARIIREYGEERWAKRIAEFIVKERRKKEIESSAELVEIIKTAIPARARRRGPHPARRTFQALRIVVNDELNSLKQGLEGAAAILSPGGRLCVIAYHSLEDRIVKNFFQKAAQGCSCPPGFPVCRCQGMPFLKLPIRRPIVPTKREINDNPRARSAKLRVAVKL